MKFGRVPVANGEGLILAHSIRTKGLALKKGEVLDASHIRLLETAGIKTVVGAQIEPGDVTENVAAKRLAEQLAGAGAGLERPFTGRCNLVAQHAGLVLVDEAIVHDVNAVDESMTLATLPAMQPVVAGEMIATVKIIPFAVGENCLKAAFDAAPRPAVSIASYRPLTVGVVSTLLPGLKPSIVAKTLSILDERLMPAGATITHESRVAHDVRELAGAIREAATCDLVILFGASAITDRRDVVPAALELAGGEVLHLGMPVDPGNLLLLGRMSLRPGHSVPVIGAPGCARSPKENGFDFVVRRFLAGLDVTGADLRRMGVGGLLNEIISRPQLRQASDD